MSDMRPPLEGAPLVLRLALSTYVVTFLFGALLFMARALSVAYGAFIVAGIAGGFYGLLLATNFQGSAVYMSERGKRRLENPSRFQRPPSPFMTEVPVIRVVGAFITVLCPLILISISVGGGG